MYKSILVPVDIEEDILTQNALRHVEYLAKMSDADVHFCMFCPMHRPLLPHTLLASKSLKTKR